MKPVTKEDIKEMKYLKENVAYKLVGDVSKTSKFKDADCSDILKGNTLYGRIRTAIEFLEEIEGVTYVTIKCEECNKTFTIGANEGYKLYSEWSNKELLVSGGTINEFICLVAKHIKTGLKIELTKFNQIIIK